MGESDKFKFSYKCLGDDIFVITAPLEEVVYLILGKERAILIDTGMGIGSLKSYIEEITNKELIVINTHGHPGHAGGNGEFKSVFMHPKDKILYSQMCTTQYRINDLQTIFHKKESEVEQLVEYKDNICYLDDFNYFDLGGRVIETMLLPGHTQGSICLYDKKSGILFAGDMINGTGTWLYHEYSTSLQVYYTSLRMLLKRSWNITKVCPGSLPSPISSDFVENNEMCARRILLHDDKGEPFQDSTGSGLIYSYSGASIIYNPNNIYEI